MTKNDLEGAANHPVDKGWAWVILFASFTVHVFSIGYERSFGLLYVEFQQKYDCSSTLISAIVGTKAACYCLTTLLVMNLGLKKINVRTSCLIGSVFQSVSVAACSLIDNPIHLIGTQGVLFGIGHGMLYCPTLYILSQYFERYRPIATAVASCGSCVGGIAFPMITRTLLRYFGLSGTLLILGSILLHQLLVMVLYTPIDDYATVSTSCRSSFSPSSEETRELVSQYNEKSAPNVSPSINRLRSGTNADCGIIVNSPSSGSEVTETKHMNTNVTSLYEGFRDFSNAEVNFKPVSGGPSVLKLKLLDKLVSSHSSLHHLPIDQQQQYSRSLEFLYNLTGSNQKMSQIHSSMPLLFPTFHLSSKSSDSEQQHDSDVHENSDMEAVFPNTMHSSSASPNKVALRKNHIQCPVPEVMRLCLFWVLLFYFVGAVVGTALPAVYVPSLALEKGLTRQDGAYFLMISASVEIVGRFLPGFVLHFQFLRPSQYMIVPFSCLAVLYLLTSVFNDFTSMLLFTLAYGLMSSSFWPVQTLIVIEVLGMDNLASAIGFYAVFMGLACSASFPFGGWLKDAAGTYSSTFIFLGAMYLMSVASLLVIVLIHHLNLKTSTTTEVETQEEEKDRKTDAFITLTSTDK